MIRRLSLIVVFEAAFLIGVLQFGNTDAGRDVSVAVGATILFVGCLAILVALAGWSGPRAAPIAMVVVAASLIVVGLLPASSSGASPATGLGLASLGVALLCIPWALRQRR